MKERPRSTNQVDPLFDADGNQLRSGLDARGREIPDPTPMSPPVGYEAPDTLEQLIRQIIHRRDFVAAAEAAGVETFEEADDFDVEDEDYDPRFPETIYEAYFEAKSKRRAQAEARRQTVSQTASEDLVSPVSPEKKVETPTAVVSDGIGKDTQLSSSSGPVEQGSRK